MVDEKGNYQKQIKMFMQTAVKTIHKDLAKIAPELEYIHDLPNESADNVLAKIDDYTETLNEAKNSTLVKEFNKWINNHILKQELKIFFNNQMHMDWIHKEIRIFIIKSMGTVKKDFKKMANR